MHLAGWKVLCRPCGHLTDGSINLSGDFFQIRHQTSSVHHLHIRLWVAGACSRLASFSPQIILHRTANYRIHAHTLDLGKLTLAMPSCGRNTNKTETNKQTKQQQKQKQITTNKGGGGGGGAGGGGGGICRIRIKISCCCFKFQKI